MASKIEIARIIANMIKHHPGGITSAELHNLYGEAFEDIEGGVKYSYAIDLISKALSAKISKAEVDFQVNAYGHRTYFPINDPSAAANQSETKADPDPEQPNNEPAKLEEISVPEEQKNEPRGDNRPVAKIEHDPTGKDPKKPGAKLDAGKAPIRQGVLEYFPRALKEIAKVSEYGSTKYTWGGWGPVEDGINRYGNAQLRHAANEVIEGPIDPESGLLHAAMEAWNTLARLELILRAQEDP